MSQPSSRVPPEIDTTVPHSARVYNYWLGGKDNYAADRALGDMIAAHVPTIRTIVGTNRAFLGRAVRYLARDAGMRQFLDIGTGIPAAGNVHEVAQEIVPDARVLYVDNDPIVLAHARALITGHPAGKTAFIHADLRRPEEILGDPALSATLDLDQPVALMLVGILMHLRDSDDPYGIVATLLDALPSGSYLTITHPTADFNAEAMAGIAGSNEQAGIPFTPRSRAEIEKFFTGLDLVEPGVVPVLLWRPDEELTEDPRSAYLYAGIGRKG
jgi:S-adenosyl methyltransferase